MTNSKATPAKKSAAKPSHAKSADVEPKHVGQDTLGEKSETAAQATFDRVKEAIPSFDDVASNIQNQTNVDLQNMADDAATFVRRNPAVSLAAAAGIGILIGVLATKRS